jgi:hypothetical protein
MNHRMIVAWIFRAGGLLFGVPAFIGLIDIVTSLILFSHAARQVHQSHMLDIQKYGIAGMISDGGQLLGGMFMLFVGLGMFIAVLVAIVFVMMIVFALFCFFTGNGIARRAEWARVMGIVLSAICLLFWLTGLHAAQNGDAVITATLITLTGAAASAYAIWALGWRYV